MAKETAALNAVLTALLPTADESLLLCASLGRGDTGRSAWTACQERFGDLVRVFRGDSRGIKRWLPLLHEALRYHELPAPPALATVLRTAAFQEELRSKAYQEIVGETLTQLQAAGVPILILKGPALERCYPRPGLRHSHDLELLIRERADLERAATVLCRAGARAAPGSGEVPAETVVLEQASGLPIRLSIRLFRTPHYHIPTETLWTRRTTVPISGVPADVLAADDTLLHILGHAAGSPSRSSLQWVADAWFLLQRHPNLDWRRLLRTACDAQLRLVLAAMLPYLARQLGAAIPSEVLASVTHSAAAAPRSERDALLAAVRASGDRGLRRVLATLSSPRERLRLLLWLLGPSRTYLRRVHGPQATALLPLLYVYRPLAYAARVLPGRLRASAQ